MKLLAGSYEKFIWGFSVKPLPSSDQPGALTLKPLFSYPSHSAPIKCVSVAGHLAASGGSDDAIKIYDLSSSSEVGTLLDHSGAVTGLAFYTCPLAPSLPRNLISSSDDGAVSIYDADSFVHLKSIPAHRRGVSDLAVHPSGRLALTVGRDSCLAMLNLVRGRRSFYCRLGREASIVRYGLEGGGQFFMAEDAKVSMHDSEDARVLHEMDCKRKVLCVAPCEGGVLYTAGEDHNITGWDTASGKSAYYIEGAHSARVKGLVAFTRSDNEASNCIASASSDGVIRVWDVRMMSKVKSNPLAETNTKSRLTCLAGSSLKYDDAEAYFFTRRTPKYSTGSRSARTAGSGTWRPYGRDLVISCGGEVVGIRRGLAFGVAELKNTGWVMYEYEIACNTTTPQTSSSFSAPITLALVYVGTTLKDLADVTHGWSDVSTTRWVLIISGFVVSAILMVCVTKVAKASLDKALAENPEAVEDSILFSPQLPVVSTGPAHSGLNQPLIIKIDPSSNGDDDHEK